MADAPKSELRRITNNLKIEYTMDFKMDREAIGSKLRAMIKKKPGKNIQYVAFNITFPTRFHKKPYRTSTKSNTFQGDSCHP
jgi:hypothetical protein